MDKRPRQANPSSPVLLKKRPKQPAKLRKTFFFQPQNTLAFNPLTSTNNADSTYKSGASEGPAPLKHTGSGNFRYEEPPEIISLDSEPNEEVATTRSSESGIRAFDRSTEQQSSDDSFDGIRWRPSTSPNKLNKPILSSPLKNTESALESVLEITGPVDNEVMDSVLCKYGVGLSKPLSQTPGLPRTMSELPASTVDSSPSLVRSKSFDPRSVDGLGKESSSTNQHASIGSRLNTWIDKFEVKNRPAKPEPRIQIHNAEPDSNRTESDLKNGDTLTDDDPFSDDDSFLASIKLDLFPQVGGPSSTATSTLGFKSAPTSASTSASTSALTSASTTSSIASAPIPKQTIIPLESDPFSDDLDLSAIENVAVEVAPKIQPSLIGATESFSKPTNQLACLRLNSFTTEEETKTRAKISFTRPDFARYQIKSIMKGTYPFKGFTRNQLIVTAIDSNDEETKLIVRGDSAELDFEVNDIIHVILTSSENPRLIDNSNNLIIWNPDILVSSTVVADQLFCPRKTVFTKRFSFPGVATIPLIVGTTVHEIFQACFITEKFTKEFMEELLDVELERRILEIYSMGDVLEDVKSKIREHFTFILNWFQTFYKKAPSEIPTNKRQQKIKFSVAEALDIEESVWSPMFGIKGIADVTLRANLEGNSSSGQFLLPMEIKTSRQYLGHQAQAALYSLLFKDRYNMDITSFLLVYTLEEGSTKKHDISIPDLKSLINLRNRISTYLRPGRHELPDLMRQQKCDNCTIQQSCMTVNFLTEGGTAEASGLNDGVYEDLTEQLSGKPIYAEFYEHWDQLLSKEEAFMARFNKDLWVLTAQEREKEQGKALSDLVIAKSLDSDIDTEGFQYTFKRKSAGAYTPMDLGHIMKYDKVIISDDNGHFALALGFVRHIDAVSVTIATKRRILPTELKTDKFHRAGVLRTSQIAPQNRGESIIFRIDKDEMFYGMGVARFNVLNLFLFDGDSVRRRLVVEQDTPKFDEKPFLKIEDEEHNFNPDQVSAFRKAFLTKDYSLILGMPGTGKTTVIAQIIAMLVKAKKSVLLTSYTNSAVDNILLKVKEYDIDFLRIGNPSRIHKDIRRYIPGEEGKKISDYESFSEVYLKPYVVGSTCLSIRDLAFNVRDHFDYCIIDEASQVSMPLSLGPLALCDKFILVGDHFQLPPLVTHPSPEVKQGLSRSLFQMLAESHPQSVVELTYQYRMCRDIMLISNALVYENRLKCGSESVAEQQLVIPEENLIETHINPNIPDSQHWLQNVFNKDNKVLFLNHDNLKAYERSVGENVSNLKEVELTRQIVEALCTCGVDESKIGVMTLYRSQLKLLVETFRHRPNVEVLTADRFQGRDKECIIISLVRSNKERKAGELIKDWRRVNVAVTRARSKLIILGSLNTLLATESLLKFLNLVKTNKWMYDLPESALDVYRLKATSQLSSSSKVKPEIKTIGSKVIGRHPIVRDILSDMNIN